MVLRRPITILISGVAMACAATLGMPSANAIGEDERFLVVLSNLGIHFEASSDAIAAGRAVCDQVAAGQVRYDDPAAIRAGIVEGLMDMWMDNAQAANMMWGAVDIYCPQYTDIVGD